MASGNAKRFGSNKLMADFHGEPLLCRVLHATDGIFDKRIVVTRSKEVASLCQDWDVEVVLHDLPYRNDTVRLGLNAVGETDGCLFCPGDQPLLKRETVEAMVHFASGAREFIWRTAYEGIPGSPVLFPAWTFPELMTLPEGKGGNIVIKKYEDRLRLFPVSDRYELMDVDTPDDLEFLRKR